jgi:hypothetical protein
LEKENFGGKKFTWQKSESTLHWRFFLLISSTISAFLGLLSYLLNIFKKNFSHALNFGFFIPNKGRS